MARKKAGSKAPPAGRAKRTGRKAAGAAKPSAGKAPTEGKGKLLDVDGAIAMLRTTRPTFYRWLRTGKIKGMKVGRQWRFYQADIERFLKGQEPQVELRTDIGPLVKALAGRLKAAGGSDPTGPGDSPVQRATGLMIALAARMRASDIHLEPYESAACLRVRVDGVLHPIADLDLRLLPALVEQFKRMANCDVLERRLPQDGRILVSLKQAGGEPAKLDLRVNFLPALMGEAVTLRILRRDEALVSLDRIDYAPADRQRLGRALGNPWGLLVFSGPTGSGKTTVLYACLRHLIRPSVKVMSIEDPVEYMIPGVVQAAVNEKMGMTFARAIRAFLRSDPDVMMVGEIRNRETLEICHQAALTGHLVMTTLHTDGAPETLKRMLDIGVPPFLVADAVKFVSAQRLVRCLCQSCAAPVEPSGEALARAEELARKGGVDWEALPKTFRKPVGCEKCGQVGYRGRKLIVEMLEMTPEISGALRRGAAVDDLRAIAIGQGMTPMPVDGIRRAAAGQTTLDEVFRVLSLK